MIKLSPIARYNTNKTIESIEMCDDLTCNKKFECLRFTKKYNIDYQIFRNNSNIKEEICKDFIDFKDYPIDNIRPIILKRFSNENIEEICQISIDNLKKISLQILEDKNKTCWSHYKIITTIDISTDMYYFTIDINNQKYYIAVNAYGIVSILKDVENMKDKTGIRKSVQYLLNESSNDILMYNAIVTDQIDNNEIIELNMPKIIPIQLLDNYGIAYPGRKYIIKTTIDTFINKSIENTKENVS